MTEIKGLLFDGKNPDKTSLSLIVSGEGICHLSNKPNSNFKFSKIAISPRIADSTRFLTLPDGRLFESLNNDTIDQLITSFHTSKHSEINTDKWILKTGVMLFFLALTWAGLHFGVPALTYKVAMTVPEKMLIESGQEAMKNFDKKSFAESKLSKKRQKEVRKLFNNILPVEHKKLAYKLHFRSAPKIGANAFALPSGDIIITDDLIKLSANNNEIKSILLHEIAHVELRHGVQGTIKSSAILLLVVAATGDVTSISTLLLGVPALLLDSSYNRKMEWDADSYSLTRMKVHHIDPIAFSNILEKLVKSHIAKDASSIKVNRDDKYEDGSEGYWSSHPPSKERIDRMKAESNKFLAAEVK